MKKTLILFSVILLLSCSKDDDESLPINFQNLAGFWDFKSIVKANGTISPYVGKCASQKDHINFYSGGDLVQKMYYPNCIDVETRNIELYLHENYEISTSGSFLFDGATIKSITQTSFTIEFPQPREVSFINSSVTNCKEIIFEKRQ